VLLSSVGVVSNAYVCKGPGKPIIVDLTLEEGVLHVESDISIYVNPIKDSGERSCLMT
jgi:hypothetical protein